ERLGWNRRDVVEFTIFIAIGVLVGGRAFDIAVYELDYYRQNPLDAFNWWKGGLASHGVLLGGTISAALFCVLRRKSFLQMADEVVVPAAFLFAVGRLGNFIEGGVVGSQTSMPWGVIYTSLEGARHPVALYESAKNFVIVLILIAVLRRYPAGKGIAMSAFIFLYAFLRFLVDIFRDYESYWMGLDKGQFFNLAMAALGLCLLMFFALGKKEADEIPRDIQHEERIGWVRAITLVLLCLYPLGIPTSWTQVNIEQKRLETEQPTTAD
ncbi:MAG: prolipoprotein diacylglyceryl transferase, partial [Gammaproteobacteria bacterium]|nr:prolipoprotein diacylglyceryl transferase [Gammaproteobacteria bacterium]